MPTLNPARLLADLDALAAIGKLPPEQGGGWDRRPFSPAERQARQFFLSRARQAGLAVAGDGAANLVARLPGPCEDAPTLLLGSHLDTVPNGGPLDGALGVVAALEVLRAVQESRRRLPFHLEAIAFTDEEGRFGDFFGSRAVAGELSPAAIASFFSNAAAYPGDLAATGQILATPFSEATVLSARRPRESLLGYLELHIEQGPVLAQTGTTIGVVSAIFGRTACQLTFTGRQAHAGTTPMALRADALVAAAAFVGAATALVREGHPGAVLTCGDLRVAPGVVNVVPGETTLCANSAPTARSS
jgi:beta-ureidopropionase / N-carbamoyl-L-amino-acid hydrolase